MKKKEIALFLFILISTLIPNLVLGNSKALVVFKKGNSYIIKESKSIPITVNTILTENDIIKTEKDAYLNLQLSNGVIVKIGANSQIKLNKIIKTNQEEEYKISLQNGEILSKVNKEKDKKIKLDIQSPTAIASVRGTELYIEANHSESLIAVNEGRVEVSNIDGSQKQIIEAGEKIIVTFREQKKDILGVYEKSKFNMIQELEKTKKQNLENVILQIEKNQKLLEEQKNKIQLPPNPLNQ